MCLQLFLVPARPNAISAERLARECGLHVAKLSSPLPNALSFSRDGGCSCSLMADSADWNAPTWDLDPDILENLAIAIRVVDREAGGFSLQALWAGEEPVSESRVLVGDLVRDIRSNKLRNQHVYKIGEAADSAAAPETNRSTFIARAMLIARGWRR